MSSTKFDILIDEFPNELAAVSRLRDLVCHEQAQAGHREYRSNRLYDKLQPSNYRVLVKILLSAAEKGLLQRRFRVNSASGGGIAEFDSVQEIPLELFDNRRGLQVEVSLDDIEMIFIFKQ